MRPTLDKLSPDLLQEIFTFIASPSELSSAALVCRSFSRAALDDRLWEPIFAQCGPVHEKNVSSNFRDHFLAEKRQRSDTARLIQRQKKMVKVYDSFLVSRNRRVSATFHMLSLISALAFCLFMFIRSFFLTPPSLLFSFIPLSLSFLFFAIAMASLVSVALADEKITFSDLALGILGSLFIDLVVAAPFSFVVVAICKVHLAASWDWALVFIPLYLTVLVPGMIHCAHTCFSKDRSKPVSLLLSSLALINIVSLVLFVLYLRSQTRPFHIALPCALLIPYSLTQLIVSVISAIKEWNVGKDLYYCVRTVVYGLMFGGVVCVAVAGCLFSLIQGFVWLVAVAPVSFAYLFLYTTMTKGYFPRDIPTLPAHKHGPNRAEKSESEARNKQDNLPALSEEELKEFFKV